MQPQNPFDEVAILRAQLMQLSQRQAGLERAGDGTLAAKAGSRPGWPIQRLVAQATPRNAS